MSHNTKLVGASTSAGPVISPLFSTLALLTSALPSVQFSEIVVSVARKTDAAMWPALFAAVGAPSALLEGLVEAGALASAACALLIVDCIQGAAAARSAALRLIRVCLNSTSTYQPANANVYCVALPVGRHLAKHISMCTLETGFNGPVARHGRGLKWSLVCTRSSLRGLPILQ